MASVITAALTALSFVGYNATSEPDMSGYTSRYNPGIFRQVIEWRISVGCDKPSPRCYGYSPLDWREYDGYMATLDCADVGKEVYARPGAGWKWERFLIADCSGHESTTRWFNANGIVAEIDHASFMRWKAAGFHTGRGMPIEIRSPEIFYEYL